MFICGEWDMMVLSLQEQGDFYVKGVSQFDLIIGKIVVNWQFEKDGILIFMLDVINDIKFLQLDFVFLIFLGLDINCFVCWDMCD